MNLPQANPSKYLQREIPLLGDVLTEVIDLPGHIVAMCDTEQAAFRLCINQSRVFMSQEDIGKSLGFDSKGTFNAILNSDHSSRPRYLSRSKQVRLQQLCGNRAIDQWADMYGKGLLNCQRSIEERKAELEADMVRLQQEKLRLEKAL